MKKSEMLNLVVGSIVKNKKGKWEIREIQFEVFEDGKYMYGSDKAESYKEVNEMTVGKERKKVIYFYLHNIDTTEETNKLLRESIINWGKGLVF